jgi:NADPH:quinone reductase-like Zn-dependent oxidoreductase
VISAPAARVLPLPDDMSFEAAAAAPVKSWLGGFTAVLDDVAGIPPADVTPEKSFAELGLDSPRATAAT